MTSAVSRLYTYLAITAVELQTPIKDPQAADSQSPILHPSPGNHRYWPSVPVVWLSVLQLYVRGFLWCKLVGSVLFQQKFFRNSLLMLPESEFLFLWLSSIVLTSYRQSVYSHVDSYLVCLLTEDVMNTPVTSVCVNLSVDSFPFR